MLRDWLRNGAAAMGIALTEEAVQKLAMYHAMLTAANKTMNLTRVLGDAREAADRNYLDSLSPLAVKGLMDGASTLIDVGSGAGCPGIPLAIALPDVRVTLLDSQGKRVRFLRDVIGELKLNAVALHARSEDAARDPALRSAFDRATARAVADTPVLVELCLPFVRVGGVMVAYKGPAVAEELSRAGNALHELGGRVRGVLDASVPGRDWDHRLLVVDKVAPTPGRYPRKAGEPGRRPL